MKNFTTVWFATCIGGLCMVSPSMVDSPGLTENDEEGSVGRAQHALRLLIRATRSAEEASQVCTPREFSIRIIITKTTPTPTKVKQRPHVW